MRSLDQFRNIILGIMDIEALPGGDLICEGIDDLAAGRESAAALLVAVGAPRLRRAGLQIPSRSFEAAEQRLPSWLAWGKVWAGSSCPRAQSRAY